jgi:preprotein translocase subunit SecG
MPRITSRIKKIFVFITVTLAIGIVAVSQLKAADASASGGGGGSEVIYLQQIAAYTNSILTAVTTPVNPVVMGILLAMTNLTAPDNAQTPPTPTPALQAGFTTYNFLNTSSNLVQTTLQTQLMQDYFSGATTNTLPYANDLTYSTLLGLPFFSPDPRASGGATVNPAYNYLKNASGLNVVHAIPAMNWTGAQADQAKYQNYYNTISAVQTFNSYVLTQLYANSIFQLTTAQNTLLAQVSNPSTFFAVITNETIGAVLRQMLMFESQNYVLLAQLLQAQRLLLASQAMNNTLMIVSNSTTEALLLRKAIAPMPGSTS